jgi:hypothetical protein
LAIAVGTAVAGGGYAPGKIECDAGGGEGYQHRVRNFTMVVVANDCCVIGDEHKISLAENFGIRLNDGIAKMPR